MNALAKIETKARFNPDQVDLIKKTICPGATDDELRLFLYHAEKTGLDPLARQIYSVERQQKRGNQWVTVRSIQTSIDGFRLVAQRSGEYAGQVGPQWCGQDSVWVDVWLKPEPPAAARVGVWRNGFKEPCWGVARYEAYAQMKDGKPTYMWAKMADVMIAKCAESLALRKAFPQELSGLYTGDEMEQAQDTVVTRPQLTPPAAPKVNGNGLTEAEERALDRKFDPKTGEIRDDDSFDDENLVASSSPWDKWANDAIDAFNGAKTGRTLSNLLQKNSTDIEKCQEAAPATYDRLMAAYRKRAGVLSQAPLATDQGGEALPFA